MMVSKQGLRVIDLTISQQHTVYPTAWTSAVVFFCFPVLADVLPRRGWK